MDRLERLSSASDRSHAPGFWTPAQLAAMIWRRRLIVLCVALSVWIMALAYVLFAYHPKYSSQATALIRDSAITARYLSSDPVTTTSAQNANPVLNAIELLKSDAIRDALWTRFVKIYASSGKGPDVYANYGEWVRKYGDGKAFIKAKNPAGTDVIALSFTWSDQKLAQRGMATVFAALQEESRRLNQSEHRQRYAFLSRQREGLAKQLADVRQQIAALKRDTKTVDVAQSIQNYAKGRVDFELAAATANAEATAASARFGAYQKSLGMSPEKAMAATALGRNTTLAKLYDKSYDLSEQLASLKTRYTPQSKQVQQLSAELAQVRGNIDREVRRTYGATAQGARVAADLKAVSDETRGQAVRDMLDAQAQSQAQRLKADLMKSYLTQIDARMQSLPQTEEALANLKQTEDALSQSLRTLETQTLDARLREAQTLSNVFLIDQPSMPIYPLAPTRMHFLAAGLLMGALAGAAMAILREKLSPARAPDLAFAPPSRGVSGYEMDKDGFMRPERKPPASAVAVAGGSRSSGATSGLGEPDDAWPEP